MKKTLTALLLAAALTLTACSNSAAPQPSATPLPDDTVATKPEDDKMGDDAFGVTPEDGAAAQQEPDAELLDIVTKMQEIYPIDLMMVETVAVDLTDESWYTYQTGLNAEQAALVDAAVLTEPGIGSQPFSMVLLRVKNADDAQTVADAVLDNVNMRKWVCVAADYARVVTFGDKVLFVMTERGLVDADQVVESAASALNVTFDYDMCKESVEDSELPPEMVIDQPVAVN